MLTSITDREEYVEHEKYFSLPLSKCGRFKRQFAAALHHGFMEDLAAVVIKKCPCLYCTYPSLAPKP